MSTIDVSIGQIVKLKWPERTGNATAIQQSQSLRAHSRIIEARHRKKETVSKRGNSWRLSGDDVVELVTRMPPLERFFCAVASSVWLAQWLGIT